MNMNLLRASKAPTWLLSFLLVGIITATAQFEPLPFQQAEALKSAQKLEPIQVLVLENPLTFYKDKSGATWGVDYERLQDFSKKTGLRLDIKRFKNKFSLMKHFNSGKGHIVVSRDNSLALGHVSEGPLFEEIEIGLFCHRKFLKKPIEEATRIEVVENLKFENSIKDIIAGKLDCFKSEVHTGLWATQPYISVQLIQKSKSQDHYTWKIRHGLDDIKVLLHSWYRKSMRAGTFETINHRFDLTLHTLKDSDIRRFLARSEYILPNYKMAFKDAAREVKLPWALLAAVAYQESQWDPTAVSYTGVKGLMQLTLQTAKHMGVADREDPFESIWGGSRYLKHLWQEWAEVPNKNDRLMMTLASYNIGIAHMFDVVDLLESRGQNPYKWVNIEKVLPELEKEHVHSKLRYGFARGRETVGFVNRTYSFYQLLSLQR
jgi:membrane-bound lytic murein transglycosylase F